MYDDVETKRFDVQSFDYRSFDLEKPTYTHPATWSSVTTKVSVKGPPGRRRRILPLYSTPYVRSEILFQPAIGEAWSGLPNSTYLTKRVGVISRAQADEVLRATGFFSYDPALKVLIPQVSLAQRSAVENEILKFIKSQSLDIATSLAEAGETIGFIATRTAQTAKAVDAIYDRDWKAFRNAITNSDPKYPPVSHRLASKRGRKLPIDDPDFKSRTAAQNWLEYNYAVVPLLIDIDGAAKELADYFHNTPAPVAAKSYKTSWAIASDELRFSSNYSNTGEHLYRFVGKMDHRRQVIYRLDGERLKALSRLGVTNPAAVIWEKTRLSFVIDWLVPVGDFLSGWDATLGCTFIDGHATTHCKVSSQSVFVPHPAVKKYPIKQYPESLVSYTGWVRTPLKTFPYPSIQIDNPYTPSHVATVLALLKTFFFRGR